MIHISPIEMLATGHEVELIPVIPIETVADEVNGYLAKHQQGQEWEGPAWKACR
jgi:hypothetical protein